MPRISASFVVSGDEKIALDPVDSSATLDVEYGRAPSGTTIVTLHAVVRAYRTDIPSERPTTFAIRVTLPEGATEPTSARDLEAYLTTWGSAHGGGVTTGGKHLAPRSYATVSKSALTWSTNAVALEIRGSITLKDVPTGKSVTLEKLTIRKTGDALLPVRSGPFHAP